MIIGTGRRTWLDANMYLHLCVCMHYVHAGALREQKRALDSLELRVTSSWQLIMCLLKELPVFLNPESSLQPGVLFSCFVEIGSPHKAKAGLKLHKTPYIDKADLELLILLL